MAPVKYLLMQQHASRSHWRMQAASLRQEPSVTKDAVPRGKPASMCRVTPPCSSTREAGASKA